MEVSHMFSYITRIFIVAIALAGSSACAMDVVNGINITALACELAETQSFGSQADAFAEARRLADIKGKIDQINAECLRSNNPQKLLDMQKTMDRHWQDYLA